MPDNIGIDGLTVKTAAEITADLVAGLKAIYGNDINTDSNSPDGQLIGILTQMNVDLRELLVSINSSFDPDQAVGALLDQRAAINNIQRIGGTFTIQPISITTNQTVTLQGLDDDFNDPNGVGYTIQDGSGNQFILSTTTTLLAGTTVCDFRAALVGNVNVPINTLVNPVTVVLGVTGVNNPTPAITVGQNQETDAQFRLRRQRSVANASTGYLNGLLGKILSLPGVTEAVLYENVSNVADGNGTPPHCIWLVVAGGSNADIGNTIYNNKSYGCDMRGAQTFDITTASGSLFVAKWDVPTGEPLFIRFTIKTTTPGYVFSQPAIKTYIQDNLDYGIGEFAETSRVTSAAVMGIASQGGGGVPVLVEISDDGMAWTDYLDPTDPATEFTVAAANIAITVI